MKPRCGRLMHPYEACWGALLDDVVCGRPDEHNGRCRSVQSINKARERQRNSWPKYGAQRKERKRRMRLAMRAKRQEMAEMNERTAG